MNADCCICEDVFTGRDGEVVHSTLCGHIFHFDCLKEWLRRSKTCPQCRSYVSEHNTVKLYFQVSSGQSTQTPRILENEIASLKRQMVMQNLDIQTLAREKEGMQDLMNCLRSVINERDVEIKNYERKINESEEKLPPLMYRISLQEVEISKLNNEKVEAQLEADGLRVSLQRSELLNKNQETRMSALQKRVNYLDDQIKSLKRTQLEITSLRRRVRRYERTTSSTNESTDRTVEKPQLRGNEDKTDTTNSGLVENPLMILGDEKVNSALRFLGGEEAENSLVLLGDADVFKNLGMRLEGSEEDKKSANDDDSDSVILLSDDDDDVKTLDVRSSKRKEGTTPNPKRWKGSQSDDNDSVILLSDDEPDNSFRLLNNEEVTKNLEMCGDTTNEDGKASFPNEMDVSNVLLTNQEVVNSLMMLSNDEVLKFEMCCDLSFENSAISNTSEYVIPM